MKLKKHLLSTAAKLAIALAILQFCFMAELAAQTTTDSLSSSKDSTYALNEIVIAASRNAESVMRSPVSIEQLTATEARSLAAPTCFDAIEHLKGMQVIAPSLGFKVINARGFANTTNVRFCQMVDGFDNQAPHIGAPIANALGANDLDIAKIEIVPGTASALYGMNAINGLANIQTKNPFDYPGLSVQQFTGINHLGNIDDAGVHGYSQTNFRYAKPLHPKFAFKVCGSYTDGNDWVADNRTDLAPQINASTGLLGSDNPASDPVNGYGNESSNRKTLTLGGKQYVVARTGYREAEIADYGLQNFKGDVSLYWRPRPGHDLSLSYKGALLNNIYQRSNRFRLQDYALQQYGIHYEGPVFQVRSYLTLENTGKSYNLRSLAENMDRAYKPDNVWFADYTTAFNSAVAGGLSVADAHHAARESADQGRFEPGSAAYNEQAAKLTDINNWDYGAALRVKSQMAHAEGLVSWDKLLPKVFVPLQLQALMGVDHRTYVIIPDGNYFINPEDTTRNLTYGKTGAFLQAQKDLLHKRLRVSGILRADKADYFSWKFTPRVNAVFSPMPQLNLRASYQSGYRFPSLFEGFSNVNSGGVKRVGGLEIMSQGVFESSYTKASIDAFQAKVTSDINTQGISQAQAIANNAAMLQKNPYTYLQPEFVRSFELGAKGFAFKNKLVWDADFYYNAYENFIAQMEASIPKTNNPDSTAIYLYSKATQSRYRLWTNSKSKVFNYGASLGLRWRCKEHWSFAGNVSFAQLDYADDQDGLEDGFNTPAVMVNASVIGDHLWRNLGASVTGRYQTAFDYVSFLVSGEVPAYWTVDAMVNYEFEQPHIIAKLGATNVLNQGYYTILGGPQVGGLYYLSLIWEFK